MEHRERVIWSRTVYEEAHTREELRVVQYGNAPPVLEKRHFWLDSKTSLWRVGKCRGMTGLDLAIVLDRLEEFQAVLLEPWRKTVGGGGARPSSTCGEPGRDGPGGGQGRTP